MRYAMPATPRLLTQPTVVPNGHTITPAQATAQGHQVGTNVMVECRMSGIRSAAMLSRVTGWSYIRALRLYRGHPNAKLGDLITVSELTGVPLSKLTATSDELKEWRRWTNQSN